METLREANYRFDRAAAGVFPGSHRSRGGSAGFEFRGHAALQDVPDARRLDLHASLRDPFGRWLVRLNSERRAIVVAVVADLSASMAFVGAQRKLDVLADFVACIGWSAWRSGDRFAFVGAGDHVQADWLPAPTRSRAAAQVLAERLRTHVPQGRSAQALPAAHRHLPASRSLVFVVSDFHLPLSLIDETFASLAAHQVVPVVVWQAAEFALGVRHGLAEAADPESGARRWLWWRPTLRERWLAAAAARRAALNERFAAHRLAPLYIEGAFDADVVTRHFSA
jgi:Mg-chelatase subunit ChlD